MSRCISSIATQTFQDIELIITDDTPGDEIRQLVDSLKLDFPVHYVKNEPALGPPANWNAGMRMATGKYIKLVHRDDWFSQSDALEICYEQMEKDAACDFLFAASTTVYPHGKRAELYLGEKELLNLRERPECLLLGNFVGAPSVTMIRNGKGYYYDERLKWLVDIEFYVRVLLQNPRFVYINTSLVNIGIHEGQVTNDVSTNGDLVMREYIICLQQVNKPLLNTLSYYSYYWRQLRNCNIRSEAQLKALAPTSTIDPRLVKMAGFQAKLPPNLLKMGPFSRVMMLIAYCFAR